MADDITLPSQLTGLGEALAPVLAKLDAALDEKPAPAIPVLAIVPAARAGLNALDRCIRRLALAVNMLIADVFACPDASERDVARAVGRFEEVVDGLIEEYRNINHLDARGGDEELRALVAGTYQHSMQEIRWWLHDLLNALRDPAAALRRKGLPVAGGATIALTLTLTSAPQIAQLQGWAARHCDPPAAPAPQPAQGLGFWDTLGVLALGFMIGDALFGCDD